MASSHLHILTPNKKNATAFILTLQYFITHKKQQYAIANEKKSTTDQLIIVSVVFFSALVWMLFLVADTLQHQHGTHKCTLTEGLWLPQTSIK